MNTHKTNLSRILLGLAVVAIYAVTLAQHGISGGTPRTYTPEELAKLAEIKRLDAEGDSLMEEEKFLFAADAYRQAAELQATCGFVSSNTHRHNQAKALVAANRPLEALEAYRLGTAWAPATDPSKRHGRVRAIGGLQIPPDMLSDYAILLAKMGKVEEAKMVYYDGLRHFNMSLLGSPYRLDPGNRSREPVPLLVVFDQGDPAMTYWEYSKDNLIAAALMLYAEADGPETNGYKVAHQMKPDWVYPVFHLPPSPAGSKLDQALALATTDLQLQAIQELMAIDAIADKYDRSVAYREWMDSPSPGPAIRMNSPVLQQAQQHLAQNWQKVAGQIIE